MPFLLLLLLLPMQQIVAALAPPTGQELSVSVLFTSSDLWDQVVRSGALCACLR